jgi:hypothetical protein
MWRSIKQLLRSALFLGLFLVGFVLRPFGVLGIVILPALLALAAVGGVLTLSGRGGLWSFAIFAVIPLFAGVFFLLGPVRVFLFPWHPNDYRQQQRYLATWRRFQAWRHRPRLLSARWYRSELTRQTKLVAMSDQPLDFDDLTRVFVDGLPRLSKEQFSAIGDLIRANPALKVDYAAVMRRLDDSLMPPSTDIRVRAVKAGAAARQLAAVTTSDEDTLVSVAHAASLLSISPWLNESVIDHAIAPYASLMPELVETLEQRRRAALIRRSRPARVKRRRLRK